jgi:hypothetical protein
MTADGRLAARRALLPLITRQQKLDNPRNFCALALMGAHLARMGFAHGACWTGRFSIFMSRTLNAAFALWLAMFSAATACKLDFVQKTGLRTGFCTQGSAPGCTSDLMKLQVEEQFKQIALARRCGFESEAKKLEDFYNSTTPLVVKLYECVDQPIDRKEIEKAAKDETDKNLAAMAAGCPADLKSKLTKRLPKLISIDEQSLRQVKQISTGIGLE